MNIVLLTDCLSIEGGAEKQIYALAQGLDKSTYNVFIVSLETLGRASREKVEATGSNFYAFHVTRIYSLSGIIQGLRFYFFLRKNKIDTLLTYHFSSDIWGAFWGHLAGVRIISNRRDMGFWRKNIHVLAYKLINRWVDKVIVVSNSIKESVMLTEGVSEDRIAVIYNGVKIPAISSLKRSEIGLNAQDIVIMCVANFQKIKGHGYLLNAFSEISNYPVKLVLIGEDTQMNGEIHALAYKLNIQNKVIFLGKRTNIPILLALADICVLPSLSEGMSNAVLEYMAAGKPVVVTAVGGNPELIENGFNGLLIEKEDILKLKDAMLNLVKDPQECQRMGKNGFNRVKDKFSISSMINSYENILVNPKNNKPNPRSTN